MLFTKLFLALLQVVLIFNSTTFCPNLPWQHMLPLGFLWNPPNTTHSSSAACSNKTGQRTQSGRTIKLGDAPLLCTGCVHHFLDLTLNCNTLRNSGCRQKPFVTPIKAKSYSHIVAWIQGKVICGAFSQADFIQNHFLRKCISAQTKYIWYKNTIFSPFNPS